MNRTYTNLLVAALSFSAPKMSDYQQVWNDCDQTEGDAETLVQMIRKDFQRLDKTDHLGMATLLNIEHVTYRTPTLDMAANTGAQLQYVKS